MVINMGIEIRYILVQIQLYHDPMLYAFGEASLSLSFILCGTGITTKIFLRVCCKC